MEACVLELPEQPCLVLVCSSGPHPVTRMDWTPASQGLLLFPEPIAQAGTLDHPLVLMIDCKDQQGFGESFGCSWSQWAEPSSGLTGHCSL